MKVTLRNLALGAALVASTGMYALEPTVTLDWKTSENIEYAGGAMRCGNGVNGLIYVINNNQIIEVDGTKPEGSQTRVVYESATTLNKGLFIDDAGNFLVNYNWPTSASNWSKFRLISADFKTVKDIDIQKPTESEWEGNRSDLNGRAIGDFFSEEGGLCFLTASTQTKPIPVLIREGEQVVGEYDTEAEFTAANTMAYAQPAIESMEELDEDMFYDQFYYAASNAWVNAYPEGAEAVNLAVPTAETGLPEGWKGSTQNGFDVFTLGDTKYIVRAGYTTAWSPNFIISDEEGNVVYYTEYENPATTGNGCGLFARKVNETTVDLYQVYITGVAGKSFVAKYTVSIGGSEVTLPPLYITGGFNGWDPANPGEFTIGEDGLYTYDLKIESDGFKISTSKGDWDAFNAGAFWMEGMASYNIAAGNTYDVKIGDNPSAGNFNIAPGEYTLTVDFNNGTLKVDGEAYAFKAPELYLRGAFNEWGTTAKFNSDLTVGEDGYVVYTLNLDALEGEVKIADDAWGTNFGGVAIPAAGKYVLVAGGDNMNVTAMTDVELTFRLPADEGTPTLEVKCNQFVARKAYAYELGAVAGSDNEYTVSYKATAAATAATLVLTPAEGDAVRIALDAPKAGENTATVSLAGLEPGEYTWAVALEGNFEGQAAGIAYQSPANMAGVGEVRGGAVWVSDAEYEAYGYTVVGFGKAGGFLVYNPAGELLYDGIILANYEGFAATNQSSPFRGDALRGYAAFADWSDPGAGVWLVDPLNPTQNPRNMFAVEGATKATNGTFTYNGVATGSGTSCVAFQGQGAETKMFTFDEDIYANTLVRYTIGDNDYVDAAPSMVLTDYKSKMANTNIDVATVKDGFFVTQVRADGNDPNVPALMYFDNDGTYLWDAANKDLISNTVSAIAVNPAENLLALAGNGFINVYTLAFDEWDEPVLTLVNEITGLPAGTTSTAFVHMNFDAANNLHVFNRIGQNYTVYVLPGQSESLTPAKAEDVLKVSSAVESVLVAGEADVEYYNLQGIRVENPANGIYIRRQGNTATKVYVK